MFPFHYKRVGVFLVGNSRKAIRKLTNVIAILASGIALYGIRRKKLNVAIISLSLSETTILIILVLNSVYLHLNYDFIVGVNYVQWYYTSYGKGKVLLCGFF